MKEKVKELEQELKLLQDSLLDKIIADDDFGVEQVQQKINRTQEELSLLKRVKTTTPIQKEEKKQKKEEKVYEPFNDPNLNCNQWVIEIHKKGEWYYEKGEKKFKEDFKHYGNLYAALCRLGEQKAVFFALMYYLNDNRHLFNFVLWRANFEKFFGFKEKAYRDAINAMFYYGLLERTNRIKKNNKDVCCKVYIFRADLDLNSIPSEKFDVRNPDHLQIAKERR